MREMQSQGFDKTSQLIVKGIRSNKMGGLLTECLKPSTKRRKKREDFLERS
jgi:hypothetical protein